ncbi:MAG TPA: hypothetical protein VGR57_13985 [Ktedonobacterales bacterium]|nr:hypothetical protein [Ktedonobacterales bacterium]
MNASLQVVAEYCDERGWPYDAVSEHALMSRLNLPEAELVCTADATARQFVFLTYYPITVPELKRHLMAEFVARANDPAEAGNLTLDLEDGVIAYRSSVALDVSAFGVALVSSVIERHLEAAPLWLPGIAGVCYLDMSPLAALAHCDAPWPVDEVMRQANDRMSA